MSDANTPESIRAYQEITNRIPLATPVQNQIEHEPVSDDDIFKALEQDKPLPEDDAILAAHPMRTGRHDLYEEAIRMVSAKHSKYALVDLVNWLLVRATDAEAR